MKGINTNEYFRPKSYVAFLAEKLKRGQIWKTAVSLFDKIRKYTFISGLIRAMAFIIALLEKSAILLLIVSGIFLLFPLAVILVILYLALCAFLHARWNKKIRNWLVAGETVTVFITKERVFSTTEDKLFLKNAKLEASRYAGPVIIVCADPFIAAKWYSFNLLAIKEDYFFTVRRKFIEKNRLNSTFIVL